MSATKLYESIQDGQYHANLVTHVVRNAINELSGVALIAFREELEAQLEKLLPKQQSKK